MQSFFVTVLCPEHANALRTADLAPEQFPTLKEIIDKHKEISEETELITWQLITTTDVQVVKGGAILFQNGKQLKLENLSHPGFHISVVSLYPAPLSVDKQMEGLTRIEIRIPAWTIEGGKTIIKVRLTGEY